MSQQADEQEQREASAKENGRKSVQMGDAAPNFTLPNQAGEPVRLSDYLGKKSVVLYFYPKDNTIGCTAEACAFRDSYEIFKDAGAEVIGVSSDSTESHEQFASQHHLPFILLSDAGGVVRKLYDVPTTLGFIPGRVTFIIDRQGIVRHIFSSQMQVEQHVKEALQTLQTL